MPGENEKLWPIIKANYNEKFWSVINSTYSECQRQLSIFDITSQVIKANFIKGTENIRALGLNFMTQNISNPVFEHLKYNQPKILEHIKAQHRQDDGWVMWAHKGVYNTGVDLVAKYGYLAINPVQTFLGDVARKMPKETFDALDPRHLFVLFAHHHLGQRWLAQRFDQISTPYQFYKDFQGTFQKSIIQTKGAFTNLRENIGSLDGGPIAKSMHLSRVIIDMTEQTIAAKLGVALALFSIYQIPTFRRRTNESFNTLFPKGTVRGFWGRMVPVRFIFSKPLARLHGNPVLSLTIASYLIAVKMAKTIEDSLALKKEFPEIHGRLTELNRDVVNAPLHLNFRKTAEEVRKK